MERLEDISIKGIVLRTIDALLIALFLFGVWRILTDPPSRWIQIALVVIIAIDHIALVMCDRKVGAMEKREKELKNEIDYLNEYLDLHH